MNVLDWTNTIVIHWISVVRGYLGRCKYRRKLEAAKKEAERVKHLLDDVCNKTIHLGNELQIAKQNDKSHPSQ